MQGSAPGQAREPACHTGDEFLPRGRQGGEDDCPPAGLCPAGLRGDQPLEQQMEGVAGAFPQKQEGAGASPPEATLWVASRGR